MIRAKNNIIILVKATIFSLSAVTPTITLSNLDNFDMRSNNLEKSQLSTSCSSSLTPP